MGDALADGPQAPAAPRPHLRRNVVHDGDSTTLQLASEAQIELGVVDQHRECWRVALDLVEDGAEDRPELPHVSQDLEQAHHGEVPDVGKEAATLCLEAVAPQTEHLHGPRLFVKVVDEVARVKIPGRLAAGNEQPAA